MHFLLHIGTSLAAITFAGALVAAGVPRGVALISAGILAGAVIGLVTHRGLRRDQARIAAMPADDAEAYKARSLRSALIWATVLLVALIVLAAWAQTAHAFVLLALWLGVTVWLFRLALRERDR